MTDPLLQLLNGLPPASLDPSRADRIRNRCHAVLARGRRRAERHGLRRVSGENRGTRLWTSIVAGLGGIYMTAVVRQALTLYGLL